ncbi:MAG: calcium-binding protein [Solirubrobacteraceae bacterium]
MFPAADRRSDLDPTLPGRSAGRAMRRAAGLAVLVSIAAAAPASARVIVGTPGPDRLVGRDAGGDLLFGGGGANTLIGGPGPDVIYGVRSSNAIYGAGGDNYIEGGNGGDHVHVGDGNNTIYTGSGLDTIDAGNGNNYVDPGGAPDKVTLGNGNNVLNGGSGGVTANIGNGNNVVYLLSGPDIINLGTGVNQVYTASAQFTKVNCGGNPLSTLYVNAAADPTGQRIKYALRHGRVVNCANIVPFNGPMAIKAQMVGTWQHYDLRAGNERAKLFGGHGGGTIQAGNGDNVIWADSIEDPGGRRARAQTSHVKTGNGNNLVYGGRGTNWLTVGDGNNFVRAGAYDNHVSVGDGDNVVNLAGKGHNVVDIHGGQTYVSSFANGTRPRIRCLAGADGTIVYGNTKPITNCRTVASARSKRGQRLQVLGVNHIVQSDPVVNAPIQPGQDGIGVPRPTTAASLEELG